MGITRAAAMRLRAIGKIFRLAPHPGGEPAGKGRERNRGEEQINGRQCFSF